MIEHFGRLFGWQPKDDGRMRLEKMERELSGYETHKGELVLLFAALMSLPLSDDGRYSPLDLTPEQLRERTGDMLVALTLEEAERQPMLDFVVPSASPRSRMAGRGHAVVTTASSIRRRARVGQLLSPLAR